MTYQQQAIKFFSTTEKTGWVKNQIVEKLRELAEDYPMDQGQNQYTSTHLANRIDNHDNILNKIFQRLTTLEKTEISSPPDDDAPF